MNRSGTRLLLAMFALSIGLVVMPQSAEARRSGIGIINTGQDIFLAGDLPEPYKSDPQLANAKAGFICDIFGVFWTYVSIRDCAPVAFEGDTYYDEAEISAAVGEAYSRDDMQVPFWQKWGKWLAGIVILVIVIGGSLVSDDDEE